MEDEVDVHDALNAPLYFAPVATPELDLDTQLGLDCLEETLVIRPSLGEECKTVDITNHENHLTPDVIREGGEDWIDFYWTMVDLIIPGEKTLLDPRDPVIGDVTTPWINANFNAKIFVTNFFNPKNDMPQYDINNDEFQAWLLEWRSAAHVQHYGPGESEGNAVPTRDEIAAYKNQRERHLLNLVHSFGTRTCVHYEVFIMWDFSASAAEGECTSPRVSASNIRLLFDVVDAYSPEHLDRLELHFVFKDVRQGRYAHVAKSKRQYDCDTRLGHQWVKIVKDAIRESQQLTDDLEEGLYPNIDAILPLKWDIAHDVRRKMLRTFGRNNLLDRGQLKFMMFDAFKESRRARRQDPDVRRWLREA
ncbi:hypothetical protein KCU64_g3270, partial [Aureobasidium melanogenum]